MVNPIQFTSPQAYSGGADFTPLANLGNVYQAAQERARQQEVLAQLGPDMDMNTRALISSKIPGLAQLGLNLHQSALNRQREDAQQAIVNARMAEAEKRAGAHLDIAQAQARREQEAYAKKVADEAAVEGLFAAPPGGTAPVGPSPSPFPAPLPGPIPQQNVPASAMVSNGETPFADRYTGVRPPVVAEGGTDLPPWASANATMRAPGGAPPPAEPPTTPTDAITAAAATAGLSREQLVNMYRNTVTRPQATAILQHHFSAPANEYEIKTRKNADGTEELVRVKKSGPEGPIGGAGVGAATAVDPAITGEDFLSQITPARANTVKAIAEGRMQPPSGFALKNPAVLSLLRDVAQYEPGFDLTLWKSRNQMQTSATSGKVGQNIASFNTAIGHLDTLDKSIDALGNTGFTPVNAVINAARRKVDPAFDVKMKNFEAAKTALVEELPRVFRGTGGNVHDIKAWEAVINSSDSPQAMRAAVTQMTNLIESRIEALGDQYNRGMQFKVPTDMSTLLSPKAKTIWERVTGRGNPLVDAAASSPPPPPATTGVSGTHNNISFKFEP